MEPFDERREALVEAVAREIRLRGPDRAGRPLPRGQPSLPSARRARDALLRPGPGGAVRRGDPVRLGAPARRRRHRGADRPARGAGRGRRLGRLSAGVRVRSPAAGRIGRVSSEQPVFATVDRGTATVAVALVGRVDCTLAAARQHRGPGRCSRGGRARAPAAAAGDDGCPARRGSRARIRGRRRRDPAPHLHDAARARVCRRGGHGAGAAAAGPRGLGRRMACPSAGPRRGRHPRRGDRARRRPGRGGPGGRVRPPGGG